ncbi:UNVERIFIED_CONTAM: TetR/AcrR family transcriptional regulator [Halobacillus marinus]|uniref:TetR/AcrR family transcriptional regulator n=1 Tax=Halobacillus sp. BAB-2008 TaxID=1246484 RepID=UPI0002A50948|nr:TetR/AcrR family transcriptional regulator [Halobacillus sp. BAB-2008]ELK45602.1 transcriptional regulator [Halobacillus sp. BAB-2008]
MKAQQTWEKLLDETERLIKEKGCQKTTLKDIMERTGLTKGGIYHYVESKNELFAQLMSRGLRSANERFYEAAGDKERPELDSPLRQTLDTFHFDEEDVSKEIFLYLISQRHDSKVAELLQEHHQSAFQQSKQWIEFGKEHGVIGPHVDAEKVSELFLLIGYGMNMYHAVSKEPVAMKQEELFHYMKRLLAP